MSAPVGLIVYAAAIWLLRAVRRDELDLVLGGFGLVRRA
jgi:hypothetical protein